MGGSNFSDKVVDWNNETNAQIAQYVLAHGGVPAARVIFGLATNVWRGYIHRSHCACLPSSQSRDFDIAIFLSWLIAHGHLGPWLNNRYGLRVGVPLSTKPATSIDVQEYTSLFLKRLSENRQQTIKSVKSSRAVKKQPVTLSKAAPSPPLQLIEEEAIAEDVTPETQVSVPSSSYVLDDFESRQLEILREKWPNVVHFSETRIIHAGAFTGNQCRTPLWGLDEQARRDGRIRYEILPPGVPDTGARFVCGAPTEGLDDFHCARCRITLSTPARPAVRKFQGAGTSSPRRFK